MESEAAVPLSNSQSQPQTTTTITTPTPQQQQQQQVQVQVQQQQEQYQVQQQQQQQHQHLHSSSIQNPHLRPPSWVSTPMAVPQFHTQQQQQQQQQFRPLLRNSSSNNHTHTLPQNFQGHAILRPPAGLPTTTTLTPTTIPTVSSSSHHQPWLSQSACPPLPSPSQSQSQSQSPLPPQSSFRPGPGPGPPVPVPVTASVPMHQRSLIPNQPQSHPQPMLPTSQPQLLMSSSQQQLQQHHHHIIQSHENYGQPHPRTTHPVTNQQPIAARVQASTNQRPPSTVMPHPTVVHSFPTDKTQSVHPAESCDRILSKRTIQDLLNQVDPSEKLDPDVEDVLVDIADDFIDSVMTFGCSLAKHRKSSALEAKDILLHLERTWNMTLPGFSGDEIKTYKKPVVNDIHKERLAVIKKSLTGAEMNKSSTGQTAGNVKGHLAKA